MFAQKMYIKKSARNSSAVVKFNNKLKVYVSKFNKLSLKLQ